MCILWVYDERRISERWTNNNPSKLAQSPKKHYFCPNFGTEIANYQKGNNKIIKNTTEDEKNFGKFLSKEKNDLFIKKQKQELDKVNYILSQLEKAKEEKSEKVLELQAKAKKIEEVIS